MSVINQIESAIMRLEGGKFQKMANEYLTLRLGTNKIIALGSQLGTDKTTKGTPDAYIKHDDGTFTLIEHSTTSTNSFKKIKDDVSDCLNPAKTGIKLNDIKKIICTYTSNRLIPGEMNEIGKMFDNIELIGINEMANDIYTKYPRIAKDYLGLTVDSGQIMDVEEFILEHNSGPLSTPFTSELKGRSQELVNFIELLEEKDIVVVRGDSGIGKTNFALIAAQQFARKEKYCLKVIKDNGLNIKDDISLHLMDNKNYVIVIDDANQVKQLEKIFTLMRIHKRDFKVKIILTVRTYVMKSLEKTLLNRDWALFELKKLDKEVMDNIIKERLGIESSLIVNRISDIALSNVRLAIMACISYEDQRYEELDNASEIYDKYYSLINLNEILNKTEQVVLTIISVFRVIELEDTKSIAFEIAEDFGVDVKEFTSVCNTLNKMELVENHEGLVVKVADETLGNYIAYKIIFVDKIVNLKKLLIKMFPQNLKEINYLLHTSVHLFRSENLHEFIEETISSMWKENYKDSEYSEQFIKSFYYFMTLESLVYIEHYIKNLPEFSIDLSNHYDFSNQSYSNCNEMIGLLGYYRYTEYLGESIDLFLELLNKLILDQVYLELIETSQEMIEEKIISCLRDFIKRFWTFNTHSHQCEYDQEYQILDSVFNKYESEKDINIAVVALWLVDEYLSFEAINYYSTKNNTIEMQTITLLYGDGIKRLRSLAFEILSKLYDVEVLKPLIMRVIQNYKNEYLSDNNENSENIMKHDIDLFLKNFDFSEISKNWDDALLMYSFYSNTKSLNYKENYLAMYKHNKLFYFYDVLSMNYFEYARTYKKEDPNNFSSVKLSRIKAVSKDISVSSFEKMLFEVSNSNLSDNHYDFNNGLLKLLKLKYQEGDRFLDYLSIYFDFESRLNYFAFDDELLAYLLELLSLEEALSFIDDRSIKNKNAWKLGAILQKPEKVDVELLLMSLDYDESDGNFVIPLVKLIEGFSKKPRYISHYIFKLSQNCNIETSMISHFFSGITAYKDVNSIFSYFNVNEVAALENIYLKSLNCRTNSGFDYNGLLFNYFLNEDFLRKVIHQILATNEIEDHVYFKIQGIWDKSNYVDLANILWTDLISKYNEKDVLIHTYKLKNMYVLNDNFYTWFTEFIIDNAKDVQSINKMLQILAFDQIEDREKYIKIFLEANRNFDDFKDLYIYKLGVTTYSGSYIPYIDKEIDMLKRISSSLKGLEFLQHKKYLNDKLDSLKSERKHASCREYIEDNT